MQTYTLRIPCLFFLFALNILPGFFSKVGAQVRQMETKEYNYNRFRSESLLMNEEVARYNNGNEKHPELGLLYAGTPCNDCYEVLDKRTETTKTFAAVGTKGSHVWIQSSTDPMHYKNEQGQWLTIQPELAPLQGHNDVFSSVASPWPVTIDTRAGFTQIGKPGQRISFNRELELIFIAADGTERSLGSANWSRYTAGDDGMYVTEIWPGMDMEITVYRGATKTNFLINKPMPEYAGGQLLIRDRLKMDEGLVVYHTGEKKWSGPMEIRHVSGQAVYNIGEAIIFEKNGPEKANAQLNYRMLQHQELDIVVPGDWLKRPVAAYPVIVDPFIQASNAVPVPGSTYNTTFTGGCATLNPAPVPPHITITDIKWSFDYTAISPAIKDHGATDFRMATCRSPSASNLIWRCADGLPGTCAGNNISIFSDLKSCIPSPTCVGYDLNITMYFYRIINNNGVGCSNASIVATSPYTVTVEGWTLEPFEIGVSAPNATICLGDSTTLDATPQYGVRPFNYLWTPTGSTDSAIVVKPQVNTTYIVEFTDSCGRTARDTVEVFVTPSDNPGFTFTPDSVCPGTPITVKANDPGQLSYYSWALPGSAHPTLSGIKEFTTTYDVGGVYDIIMWYQSANCKFPDTQKVTIHSEINVDIRDTICDGESYEFYGNYYTTSGTYQHLNQTVYGCDSILILHLQVNPIPPVPILSANTPLCYGDDLQLEAAEISGATYNWTGPRGFTSTDRKPRISEANFDVAGTYSATSTKLNCTSPPGDLRVVVKPLPEIDLQADRTQICSGDSVRLETIANPVYRYQWRPDYYMVTNGAAVAYATVAYKSYLHVTVTDTGNCVNKDSVYVNTEPCCEVFLPDAFTPNSDGKNDAFRIMTEGNLKLSVFRIVNRWGMTVFATGDQHQGWDGLHNGRPQDMGTYHYYLKYGCSDGGSYEKKGSVILLR